MVAMGMLQLLWEYFGQKVCTFHTICSMIRVQMKQNAKLSLEIIHLRGKTFRERGWVLVTVLPGWELKACIAMGRRM